MEPKRKPELTLVRPEMFDDMMAMVKRISGRDPTPEELERAKVKHAQLVAELESLRAKWPTRRSAMRAARFGSHTITE